MGILNPQFVSKNVAREQLVRTYSQYVGM